MNSSDKTKIAKRLLRDQEFAEGLVAADSKNAISFQLRAMQQDRGLNQNELAQLAGMRQSQISSYLNGYDSYNVGTLRRLAKAFDVSLVISFESFGDLVDRIARRDGAVVSPRRTDDPQLAPPNYRPQRPG